MSASAFMMAIGHVVLVKERIITPSGSESKGVSLAVSAFVSISSLSEIIGVHIIPDAGEDFSISSISDYTELTATTLGLGTALGAYIGGKGNIVAMATGASDLIFTVISLVLGESIPALLG